MGEVIIIVALIVITVIIIIRIAASADGLLRIKTCIARNRARTIFLIHFTKASNTFLVLIFLYIISEFYFKSFTKF